MENLFIGFAIIIVFFTTIHFLVRDLNPSVAVQVQENELNAECEVKTPSKPKAMNKLAIALPIITVLVLFVLFITLLIIGMATMSIGFIIGAFVVGFVGVAIVDHNAEAEKSTRLQQEQGV